MESKLSYDLTPDSSSYIITNALNKVSSHKTFEKDPYDYYMNLIILRDMKDDHIIQQLKHIVTDTSVYETYNSTPLHWVLMTTGDLIYPEEAEECYFSHTSINQELAIQLFDLLVEFGGDIHIKDYYGESVYAMIEIYNTPYYDCLLKRKNNEKFIEHVIQKYNIQPIKYNKENDEDLVETSDDEEE